MPISLWGPGLAGPRPISPGIFFVSAVARPVLLQNDKVPMNAPALRTIFPETWIWSSVSDYEKYLQT